MKKETPISLRHLRRIIAILFLCPISLSSIQASAASDQSGVFFGIRLPGTDFGNPSCRENKPDDG